MLNLFYTLYNITVSTDCQSSPNLKYTEQIEFINLA